MNPTVGTSSSWASTGLGQSTTLLLHVDDAGRGVFLHFPASVDANVSTLQL